MELEKPKRGLKEAASRQSAQTRGVTAQLPNPPGRRPAAPRPSGARHRKLRLAIRFPWQLFRSWRCGALQAGRVLAGWPDGRVMGGCLNQKPTLIHKPRRTEASCVSKARLQVHVHAAHLYYAQIWQATTWVDKATQSILPDERTDYGRRLPSYISYSRWPYRLGSCLRRPSLCRWRTNEVCALLGIGCNIAAIGCRVIDWRSLYLLP